MTYSVVTTCKSFSNVSGGITLDEFFNLISHSAYEREPATIGCFLTARQHGYQVIACRKTPRTQPGRTDESGTDGQTDVSDISSATLIGLRNATSTYLNITSRFTLF
jgi:hypothetical protein